ncbi:MAG: hypothetical protein AAF074_13050 [Pseudomonadota bacterium]
MNNPFQNRASAVAGPGLDYVPLAPNDGSDLADVAIALYVETGGAVTFTSVKGNVRSVNVPNYGYVLCGVKRVHATGTSASGIHGIVVT